MKAVVRLVVGLLVTCLSGGGVAASSTGLPFKPLIIQAIDSPYGQSKQTFPAETQWVKVIRQKLGTDGPVTVETRVVKRWKQEGCARVASIFTLHEARFDDKTRSLADETFSMELNTCRDGQPPLEAMDLRALKDTMSDEPTPQASEVRRVPVQPSPAAPSTQTPKK